MASRGTRRDFPTPSSFRPPPKKSRRSSKLCAQHRQPIVPFGMGSSLEGHVNAIHGGVSIDLTRMTRVLRLSPEDLDITVEAGLTRLKLDAHLKNTGLMFPIDPGADATHRRHGRDARLRHHRGSLRDDARERAGADGGARRRPHHQDRRPRAQVIVGLRPDAAVRRLRRHARRDHRTDACACTAGPKRSAPRCARSSRWRAPPTP